MKAKVFFYGFILSGFVSRIYGRTISLRRDASRIKPLGCSVDRRIGIQLAHQKHCVAIDHVSPIPFRLLSKMPEILISVGVLVASLASWVHPLADAQETQSSIEAQRALRKGFQLAAKAMEIKSGKCAARIYHEHLFAPLGLQDIIMGNTSSDGEFTAMELAIIGQLLANEGSYGEYQFMSPETFKGMRPKTTGEPTLASEHGLGLHRIRHRRPGTSENPAEPGDLLFSKNTFGHGSLSGCILVVDPDQQLVIVQARKQFRQLDNEYWTRFFQVVADAIKKENE